MSQELHSVRLKRLAHKTWGLGMWTGTAAILGRALTPIFEGVASDTFSNALYYGNDFFFISTFSLMLAGGAFYARGLYMSLWKADDPSYSPPNQRRPCIK